jgi:hypothetical protein
METLRDSLLILHFVGMAGLFGGLLASRSKLSAAITHSALLALLSGLGLVGIRYSLVEADPDRWSSIDNAKITVKTLFLAIVLVLAYRFKKKDVLPKNIWITMVLLTLANIVIAVIW